MNDPFFIKKKKRSLQEKEISDVESQSSASAYSGNSDNDQETAAEKRIRLAKTYLSKIQSEIELDQGEVDAAEIDKDLLADRLRDEAVLVL